MSAEGRMESEKPRNRGGRPTNAQRRARLARELENVDLLVAEHALAVVKDRKASPSVRVQALQTLAGIKVQPPAAAGVNVTEAQMTDPAEYLAALQRRVHALEAHYGKSILALLGEIKEPLLGAPDA